MAINVFNPRNRARPDQRTPQTVDDTIAPIRPADTVTPAEDIRDTLGGLEAPGGAAPSAPEVSGLGVERFNVPADKVASWEQEQGQRLGAPTEIPNFADYGTLERGAAEIGRPLKVVTENQHRERAKDMKEGKKFGDTAITEDAQIALKGLAAKTDDDWLRADDSYTDAGQKRLATIANAFQIKSEAQLDRLGDVRALTTLRVADKVQRYGYERQAAQDEGENDSGVDAAIERAKTARRRLRGKSGVREDEVKKISPETRQRLASDLKGNLHGQPILRGMLTDYANYADQAFNPEKGSSTYNQPSIFGGDRDTPGSQSKLQAAANFLMKDVDDGLIDFVVNKNGQRDELMPVLTEAGKQMLQGGGTDIVSVYDAEVRQGSVHRENIIQAQPFPPVANSLLGLQEVFAKQPNRVDWSKTDGFKMSRVAMSLSDNVGYGQHSTSIALQHLMAADIASGNQRFASTLTEISQADQDGYYEDALARGESETEAEESAAQVISTKQSALQKAFQTYETRAERMKQYGTTALYGTLSKSVTTGRVNEMASDVNLGAHKGTLRMAHTWGNIAAVHLSRGDNASISKTEEVQKIATKVARAFRDLPPGEAYGVTLDRRLKNLPEAELMVADTLYAIGTSLHGGGVKVTDADGNRIDNPDDGDYIMHGQRHLNVAAQRGNEVLSWVEQGKLPDQMPSWFHNKKGEWAWDTTIYEDAASLYNYMTVPGARAPVFKHVVEHDASQSNAFIMATLIGDTRTMAMLGAALDMPPGTWAAYGGQKPADLRAAMMQTIDEDIDRAFIYGEDADITWTRQNIRDFITEMQLEAQQNGDDPAKVYARGIVVAGLYGKATVYMYSEVRDMLAKVPKARKKMEAKYRQKFGNDWQEAMEGDLANLYSQSAQTNMAELFKFQYAIKRLTGVKAAVNGSGKIPGIAADEDIDIEYTQWNQHWESDLESKISGVLQGQGFDPAQVTTGDPANPVGDITPERGLQAAHGWRTYDRDNHEKKRGGESSINAAPPSIIQNGDWYGLMITYLMSNMNNDGSVRQVPRNIKTIHDAVLTGAGSTLIAKNAYNNVFPYQVAKAARGPNGQNELAYLSRLITSMDDDIDTALDIVEKDGGATIGTYGKFHGVGDFFDRMWFNQKGHGTTRQQQQSGQEILSEDERRENNVTLAIARKLGWVPPTGGNDVERRGVTVSPENFAALVELIVEASKVQTKEPVYQKEIGGDVSFWTKWMKKTYTKRVPEMIDRMAKLGRGINNLRR